MAASATDVIVRFLADSTSLQREIGKVQGTGTKIKTWAKGVGLAIGGAFAVKAVTDWVSAAEEAESVSKALAKALGNAGDATGEWAKHAEDLASALSRKVGVDDEVIKKGQTILATFHNLSATAGETGGAFDRATKAAVDLSKAGFGDVESASKALGKALEDPEKGIAALTKAGVQFTPVQKEQIKGFIDAGDSASAMNIILGEVESQVGGVAEASATASDKMNVAWGETQEALGKALLPVLQQIAPVLEQIAGFVEKNATWMVPLTLGIVAVVIAVKLWIGAQTLLNGLLAVFGVETTILLGPLLLIALAIAAVYIAVVILYAKWDAVWSWIGNLPWYAKVALAILVITNPILALIAAAAALAVYWGDIWNFIKKAVETAAPVVVAALGPILDVLRTIAGLAGDAWNAIKKVKDIASGGGLNINPIGPLNFVPGFGPFKIPGLASGGIVTGPTVALIGEAGPEAVIPLSGTAGFGSGATFNVNVNVDGLGADAPSIQSAVVAAIKNYVGRNGPIPGIAS